MADAGTTGAPPTVAERFTRGEPIDVEIDRIERAFADIWKAASAGGDGAVSRAALWNIIVPTRAQHHERTRKMVDELAPLLPARVLVLVEEAETAHDTDTDDGVRATIESNVVARSSGARVVYSEEITLRGRRGDARFGALVRALQVPGLCTRPRQLIEVQRCAELASGDGMPVTDLGWLRLANFRLLFAGLFDAPVGGGPLLTARRVTIHHRASDEPSALLLAAWLASTLGWLFAAAEPAAPGVAPRFRFDRPAPTAGARPAPSASAVEIALVPSEGECGTSGIVALELASGEPEALFAVRRTEQNHATLTSPIAPPRVVKLDSRRDAELCVTALGPVGRDPLFARCLALAARLATFTASA
jgi:hypothetical protein